MLTHHNVQVHILKCFVWGQIFLQSKLVRGIKISNHFIYEFEQNIFKIILENQTENM